FETQLVAQPMSVDHVHPYDILAMNGASAALAISEIPVAKHVGAVRIGKLEGDFVVNPPEERHEELELDLIVAGTDEAILMVEAGANGVTEQEILDALDIAHGEIKKLCAAMEELQQKAGKEKIEVEAPEIDAGLLSDIRASHGQALVDAIATEGKLERYEAIDKVKDEVVAKYAPEGGDEDAVAARKSEVGTAFDAIEKDTIRKAIAVDKKRPDGRAQDEIMPIDTLGLVTTKRFWHHYNFPPYSVGEAGFMRGPKRRDIGHGALAERALAA